MERKKDMARRTLTNPASNAAAEMFFPEAAAAAKRKRRSTLDLPETKVGKFEPAETKSRRVQLLMQPSLHERLKAAATAQGTSFNDYVHKVLEKSLENNEE